MMQSSVDTCSTLLRFAWWTFVGCAGLAAAWLLAETWWFLQTLPDPGWNLQALRIIGLVIVNLIFSCTLAVTAALYLWAKVATSLPDLQGWHIDRPESEFSVRDLSESYNFDDYLEQEARVFEELNALEIGPWTACDQGEYSRFKPSSTCYPQSIDTQNWNQSSVLEASNPIAGALLIHGLSDAPYSLRTFGHRLHAEGYTVIWLRVPGHGTCPSALAHVSWQDWSAAVEIGVRALRARLPPGSPLVLGGYSNGGALSIHYALRSIEDQTLPKPSAIALFSPMLGINPLARITRLYHLVGLVFRNKKAQWSNIAAEIDPFKYTSWPMNGNVQAWHLTQAVERKLAALHKLDRMSEMPPILAMQSVVDSTVVVPKLITVLFQRLKTKYNQLVLFDVNRNENLANLINLSFEKSIVPVLDMEKVGYELKVLRNLSTESQQVGLESYPAAAENRIETTMRWPDGVVSLSHVAIPFPPNDPVYGTKDATSAKGPQLGSLSMRAEPSALMIPTSLFARCRHNPFYEFMEDHVVRWLCEVIGAGGQTEEN